ncbi:hypothetical protein GFY24_24520 [Nocardia sp. SYP-A9097]|uniref:hypothetical protein n=1 Tax=Nocardia sp. SYP-A9097 TaxID=2663237 RepID=UPI00129A2EB4|nr:hypothetical protein [Nocardia sp. SYP-A9097]MRH90567.1 hypothetical protein [Nocardia sp. SYP-A9097]
MAEWISVYCGEFVELDGSEMWDWISSADLWTLAEGFFEGADVVEAALEDALVNLQITAEKDIFVEWKAAGAGMRISSVTGAEVVAQVGEALGESLIGAVGPGADRVRAHLAGTTQVVNIEMALDDSHGLGAVFGSVIALRIAADAQGLVWYFDQEWVDPEKPGEALWSAA